MPLTNTIDPQKKNPNWMDDFSDATHIAIDDVLMKTILFLNLI